ncbi:MAG: hypothetical protein JNM52_11615, partial [Betaproteobacteria bacterium]|nr:hypothetical protein [Betaproteobacteria bacterium]
YYPVPHGVWQELHALYQYAEENGFTDEVVDADKKTSIADLYVECLMLWLADPYRLMHKEVERVTELLAQNRGLVDIRSNSEGVGSRSFFVVALDADQAPKMPVQGNIAPSGEILRLIDPARLVARLEAQVKAVGKVAVEKGRATHDLTDLLFRLITLWGDPPKRQFRRNATESSVALCSGIKAIAYFADLASKEDTETEAQLIRNGGTMPLLRIPQDPVSQLVGVEEWQVLNQSAIGLRLHRESSGNVGVTVGEIVGIRFAGGRTWNVGVVRWLTLLEGSALEFGIELISPTAHSITLQPTIGSSTKSIPALLLGAVAPESDSDTALTLSDTFSDLREFELDDHGKVTHVRATTLIERTSHFDLFQFQPS